MRPPGPGPDTVARISPPAGRLGYHRIVTAGGLRYLARSEDLARLGLHPGTPLEPAVLEALAAADAECRGMQIALRLLAVRMRSRQEVADRLRRRGIGPQAAQRVLANLARAGALDDLRFARAWVEARTALRASGRTRLRHELRAKGIAPEVIEQALAGLDAQEEYDLAVALARARLRRYRGLPAEVAARRLAGVLGRRGFGAGVIARVLREVLPAARAAG